MDRQLTQILEEAPEAILISDREGTIRFWNRGAELMFGHTATEAVGQSLDLIIPENLRNRHWEGYRRVMATGDTKYKTGFLSAIAAILEEIRGLSLKNKKAAAFGTYGWSGESVKRISERLKEGGFTLINDGLKLLWNPDDQGLDACAAFGGEIARAGTP